MKSKTRIFICDKPNAYFVETSLKRIMYNMLYQACYIRFSSLFLEVRRALLFTLFFHFGYYLLVKRKTRDEYRSTRARNNFVIDFMQFIVVKLLREPLIEAMEKGAVVVFKNFTIRRRELTNKEQLLALRKKFIKDERYKPQSSIKANQFYVLDCYRKEKYQFSFVVDKNIAFCGNQY